MKPGRELLIVAAIAVLAMCIGCGVLGNPNPCDRTQSMRNALEEATGRNCDLITTADLADVLELHIWSAGGLKKSDFSELDNLERVGVVVEGATLPSLGVFAVLENLKTLNLAGNNLSELPPGVFDGLSNLQSLLRGQQQLDRTAARRV